jgi:Type IV secretion system pilin
MTCTGANNFCTWVSAIIGLLNPLIGIASAIALVIFFWGLLRYVYAAGNSEAHTKGKEMIVWGLLSIFIIFSLWGIIVFFEEALLPSPPGSATTTTSSGLPPVCNSSGCGSF